MKGLIPDEFKVIGITLLLVGGSVALDGNLYYVYTVFFMTVLWALKG